MKRLQILHTAIDDLRYGKEFYEHQQEGLGEYLLDSPTNNMPDSGLI